MAKSIVLAAGMGGAVLVAAAVSGQWWIHSQVEQKVNAAISKLEQNENIDKVSYEDLDVAPFGREIELVGISFETKDSADPVKFESMRIYDYDINNELPHYMNVAIEGLLLPDSMVQELAADDSAFADYLKSVGVAQTLPVQASFSYNYQEEENQTQTAQLAIALPEVLGYEADWITKGVPLELLYADPADQTAQMQAMMAMTSGYYPKIAMSLTDLGGVPVFMQELADEQQISVDELKTQWQQLMQMQASVVLPPGLQGPANDAIEQVGVFLSGGKSLQLSVEPEFEGSFEQLSMPVMQAFMSGDFQTVIDLLKLQVKAS
ncbi:hypothetical protein [Agaribacterium haliotis]|uniref:hypothetical protein n=1 Tax=Agaribacterium haliotis TaxID=2013869 RepID=UPI000BB55945|nr:hypothetical protein [Agaribacterium haliotis]